jgi:hypothetical protein
MSKVKNTDTINLWYFYTKYFQCILPCIIIYFKFVRRPQVLMHEAIYVLSCFMASQLYVIWCTMRFTSTAFVDKKSMYIHAKRDPYASPWREMYDGTSSVFRTWIHIVFLVMTRCSLVDSPRLPHVRIQKTTIWIFNVLKTSFSNRTTADGKQK